MFPSPAFFQKKTNWALAWGTELLAPFLRQYARRQTGPAQSSSPPAWKRALIIGDNHLGDLLYRSCSLKALKAGLPGCDFYYLVAPQTAPILEGNPHLQRLLPWARSDSPLDLSPEHCQELREMRFDAALCTNCIRYWPELLLAIRLGIPNRVGYVYKGCSGWVTWPIAIRYGQPFAAYFRDYVAALTRQRLDGLLKPEIVIPAVAEAEAAAVWQRLRLGDPGAVIGFFLTSRQATAAWPTDRYLALFELIVSKLNARMVLMGAKEDEAFLNQIAAGFRAPLPVCAGGLGLPGLAAFLKRCALVVAKDSGPRHVANAVGTRVLFFRSSSYSEIEAGRYCETETDLLPPGQFLNLRQQQDLLAKVSPMSVFQAIATALKPS